MASVSSVSGEGSAPSTVASSSASETSAVAAAPAQEKSPDDTSKLRMFLGILRK